MSLYALVLENGEKRAFAVLLRPMCLWWLGQERPCEVRLTASAMHPLLTPMCPPISVQSPAVLLFSALPLYFGSSLSPPPFSSPPILRDRPSRERERERLRNGEQRVLRRAGLCALTASHGPRAVRAAAARGVFSVVWCGLVGHTGRRAQHWSPFRGMLGWVFFFG